MEPAARIQEYYEALRQGEPLDTFFAESPDIIKCGIGERLVGYTDVSEGLREQTRTTDSWVVDSRELAVTERGEYAWFGDVVRMAWTDTETGKRNDVETRWTGAMARRDGDWQFVEMHVSRPVGRNGIARTVDGDETPADAQGFAEDS